MPPLFSIRKASKKDAEILTAVAFSAKRHWNYPEEYFQIWTKELTITTEYITKNKVWKMIYRDSIVGFSSIVQFSGSHPELPFTDTNSYCLDHLFIRPEYHHMGFGTKMIQHLQKACIKNNIPHLIVFVDPNATGFYEKMGANYLIDLPSSIPNRNIPVYTLPIL